MMHNAYTGRTQDVHGQRAVAVAGDRRMEVGRSAWMTFVAGSIITLLTALPSHAGTFKAPEGCKLEVTVQNRSCTVTQLYRCTEDPEGHQRSAIYGEDGPVYLSRIDAETRWIESFSPVSGIEDLLVEEAEDHASFSTLIETGRDDFDFWTESNRGERLRHVGHDRLTGETVRIDGVELEKTRFELTTSDENGEVLIERSGQQFISRSLGRFFGGIERQSDWTGEDRQSDDSPVLFSFPGEDGFGETTPQFDCSEMVAQLAHERPQL